MDDRQTQRPTVSFVVPCYKLGRFLAECLNSILSQSFTDFEILVMDDCSPDNTEEVMRSFSDPRIKYYRNDRNLGHLSNYNKGISLSRGLYVWLISADDRLRRPYALERYVSLMTSQPSIGYIFCPGFGLLNGDETGLLDLYYYGAQDVVFDGRQFISTVLRSRKGILSPGVMVRRECYEQVGMFPLDMPHQGDLYLWFAWALQYDVAYIAEPMVNYRTHDLNMMKDFEDRKPKAIFDDEVNVLWRIRAECAKRGFTELALEIENAIIKKYAYAVMFQLHYGSASAAWGVNFSECDRSLQANVGVDKDYKAMRSRLYARLGDRHWLLNDFALARRNYVLSIQDNWRAPRTWVKLCLSLMGPIGVALRAGIQRWKNREGVAAGSKPVESD